MADLVGIIEDLKRIAERMRELRRRLPDLPDEVLELEAPYTPEMEWASALECGLADYLEPLIRCLEAALGAYPERQ